MKLKYDFTLKHVMDFDVAVATGEQARQFNSIINMNETGRRIFELLQEGKDEEGIISAMLSEYDISEADLRTEVNTFLDQMEKEGILER